MNKRNEGTNLVNSISLYWVQIYVCKSKSVSLSNKFILRMNKLSHLILILFVFSGCSEGDFNVFSLDEDVNIGKKFSREILSTPNEFPLLSRSDYPEAYHHLYKITKAILSSKEIIHRNDFWGEVNIIDNDGIFNAFCSPGGYIYVYTDLLNTSISKINLRAF